MTDLEITKLCAEAVEIKSLRGEYWIQHADGNRVKYNPLHDDAQAMALVKKFELALHKYKGDWFANWEVNSIVGGSDKDLNRAICECVAKMQAAKARAAA